MQRLVWTTSIKGNDQAMVDGHLLQIIRRVDGGKGYWRCRSNDCGVTEITCDRNLERVRGEHTHSINEARDFRRLYIDKCKKAVRSSPTTPIPQIVNQQCAEFLRDSPSSLSVIEHLPPSFDSIQYSLYRVKRKSIPGQPTDAADLELTGSWTQK